MPDALTTRDLISMGSVIETTLPGTAVIHRYTAASDGQGGQTNTYTAVGTASCRISPIYGDEEVNGSRMTTITGRVLTLPRLTDIEERDRVVESSITYEVVKADNPRSYELCRRVELVEVD